MADMKSGVFAKNVQKRLSRAQEKVLQKLGKADETKDEQFEEYVQNFKKQETEGSRLQREMRAYLAAIKGMQEASLKLTESLHEVYEPDWYGREDVKTVGEKCDELWEDFHQKLVDGALLTLDTYLGQFPDIKNRIAKRSRKLVDYDSARHHLEALQNAKRRDEGRITKAEEEFQKAQKVFEDFNLDLQEELPSLWSRRIGFYVNTFKNISGLESKFHKEITGLCHKLFEVMNTLGDQHADKAFTIQGAPSDSGPLRIAKTPSPPEEVTQIPSPLASPNHTLAPASPAPARPKSPSQITELLDLLRKGPPVPPLPKLTPSKELQQENIISFFEDNFVPEINVTTPSQNEATEEKKEESLLDLDFDPFKPEVATPGITQSHSPMSQTLPWDLWTTNNELVQPASSGAFNGFTQPDASTSVFDVQTEPTREVMPDTSTSVFDVQTEPTREVMPDVSTSVFDVQTEPTHEVMPDVSTSVFDVQTEPTHEVMVETDVAAPSETSAEEIQPAPDVPDESAKVEEQNELAEKTVENIEPEETKTAEEAEKEGSKIEHECQEVTDGPVQNIEEETKEVELDGAKDAKPTQEITCIPSVVIEPASNHEDEGEYENVENIHVKNAVADKEIDAIPDTSAVQAQSTDGTDQPASSGSSTSQDFPTEFLFKVELLHDFEAANEDELNLKRGDIVLVIHSATSADMEAGWLTGIKESDWQQYRVCDPYKGLFPENFARKLE
ncbi:amphiphysin-like isoform X6 [Rana temporaria]|uniref:amphiphysin-like isoform X6 n=1 Tax=Rana temporaria TaxID=8407 RepID=UPI001AADB02F|nr:amphiphysin-like isoform X6 [Rana temporaria]